jgi:Fe-S cluster biogenesis protein NfuA
MPDDLRGVGERIEALLGELRSHADPRVTQGVEEAVGLVARIHGAGLARVLALAGDDGAFLARLAADELVASLLVLHGLHPLDLPARVEAALDGVRPYVHSHGGEVELVALDEATGTVHVRMLGSCDGCPSSSVTLERAVRQAIEEAAPEVSRVVLDGAEEPVLAPATPVALGRKPVGSVQR